MELTSLVSGMTEFAANLYPLKTEEELVALLSGMHHFPPGVPERARRVHERLPAGSALCSSDVGVLIDRLDTEGGLGGLYKHLAHTKEGPLHLVPSITHCAVCALNGEQVPLVVKSSSMNFSTASEPLPAYWSMEAKNCLASSTRTVALPPLSAIAPRSPSMVKLVTTEACLKTSSAASNSERR